MNGVLTFLTATLVLLSLILIVGVPVVLASPGEWESSKGTVFKLTGLWSGIVIVTGLASSFA